MINDNKGQLSSEYLLLIGGFIIILMLGLAFISEEHELNTAMTAARSGVVEGFATSSSGIYPTDSYNDYSKSKDSLLHPNSIEIINISYTDYGMDNVYNKEKVQFKVYAKLNYDADKKELDSIGDRINFNIRKSLAMSFNTTSATNKLYNPVFSPHYVFTTANVKWV